jgi:hypothetical protein
VNWSGGAELRALGHTFSSWVPVRALLHWVGTSRSVDNATAKQDVSGAMRQPATKRKKLDYPDETNGTRWAAQARKMAGKLSAEEEAEYFRKAMVKVYGGRPKEATGAGRYRSRSSKSVSSRPR